MDLEYFLKKRADFIRYFYDNATSPFGHILECIKSEKEPYISFSENDEPPFIEDWVDAQAGIEAVGQAALSMLSILLELFLKEWLSRLNQDFYFNNELEIDPKAKKIMAF